MDFRGLAPTVTCATTVAARASDSELSALLKGHFDCRPAAIISTLDLRRPQFRKTAALGHFGREDQGFRWEETDQAAALKQKAGI